MTTLGMRSEIMRTSWTNCLHEAGIGFMRNQPATSANVYVWMSAHWIKKRKPVCQHKAPNRISETQLKVTVLQSQGRMNVAKDDDGSHTCDTARAIRKHEDWQKKRKKRKTRADGQLRPRRPILQEGSSRKQS